MRPDLPVTNPGSVGGLLLVLVLAAHAGHGMAAVTEQDIRGFLGRHCGECHGDDAAAVEGGFTIDKPWPSMSGIAGRVAYASIVERLRAGDMPPPQVERRPDPVEAAGIIDWVLAQLDTPLPGPAALFAVHDRPVDGNRLPHAILFGGPRGPSVPPAPRLWRLSPDAYGGWLANFQRVNIDQRPFALVPEPGIKDYAALYSPDENAAALLLSNAEIIIDQHTAQHVVVTIDEPPDPKKKLWPTPERIMNCTPAERTLLEEGLRVVGGRPFAPLLHPQVAANRAELEVAITEIYRLALARPPEAVEVEGLVKLYDVIAGDGDCRLAGKRVLTAPLLSPEAVLRFEIGAGQEVRPGVRMLSPREIALAVSLALGAKRERGVFDAAKDGLLQTPEEVAGHVRRILGTEAIPKPRIVAFCREFFEYNRATDVFKDPLPQHRVRAGQNYHAPSMVEQCEDRVVAVLKEDRRVFEQLVAGIDTGVRGGDFAPRKRVGVLMDPAWLVAWSTNFHNDPVRRGRWIRERLLGGRVPDLPVDAAAMIPDDPRRTLRDRQSATREAACWKCHRLMDDLGLPFEAFDHYGYARAGEEVLAPDADARSKDRKDYRQAPLDTTGRVAFSGDPRVDGPVADPLELLTRLVASERVRQVFIRHAFRFFLGRNETPGDAPALQDADRAYVESGGSLRAVLVSLLSSESFLCRTIDLPEARPAAKDAAR